MESRDNPFLASGELRKKADYIILHSRISRHDLRIVDPDSIAPLSRTSAAESNLRSICRSVPDVTVITVPEEDEAVHRNLIDEASRKTEPSNQPDICEVVAGTECINSPDAKLLTENSYLLVKAAVTNRDGDKDPEGGKLSNEFVNASINASNRSIRVDKVYSATVTTLTPQQAEQVKLKGRRCCLVQ